MDKEHGPVYSIIKVVMVILTEVAGEGGPDLAPQKFLSSQKFKYLMG